MAKKYKISKSNINEFFGLFKSKNTPEKLQKVVDNDPELKKLQSDLRKINDKAKDYLDKLKERNPELYNFVQKNFTYKP